MSVEETNDLTPQLPLAFSSVGTPETLTDPWMIAAGADALQRGGWQDAVRTAFNSGISTGTTALAQRYWERKTTEGILLTPEELNDRYQIEPKYGVSGLKFTAPEDQYLAERMFQEKLKEQGFARIRATSDLGEISGFAAEFFGGFAAQFVDPIDLAANFIPVLGWGKTAYRVGKGIRNSLSIREAYMAARAADAAHAAEIAAKPLGMRIAHGALSGAADGAAGAALLEPFRYNELTAWQADYTGFDSLMNIAFGTALGGMIGAVTGAFRSAVMTQAQRDAQLSAHDIATRQVLNNRPVDIPDDIIRTAAGEPPLEVRFRLDGGHHQTPYYQSAVARIGMADIAEAIRSDSRAPIDDSIAKPATVEKAARTIAEYDGLAGAHDADLASVISYLRQVYGADVSPKTLEQKFAKILEEQAAKPAPGNHLPEPVQTGRDLGGAEPPKAKNEPPFIKGEFTDIPPDGRRPEIPYDRKFLPKHSIDPAFNDAAFAAADDILRRIAPFARREYLRRIDPERWARANEAMTAHLGRPVTPEDLKSIDIEGVTHLSAGDVIVELSARALDGDISVLARHEAVHALKLAGLFTPEEWRVLDKYAADVWAPRFGKSLDEIGREEAIADAFAYYMRGELRIEEKPRSLMDRMRDFWRSLLGRLERDPSIERIFSDIESGVIGRRGLGREGGFRLDGGGGPRSPSPSDTAAEMKDWAERAGDAHGDPVPNWDEAAAMRRQPPPSDLHDDAILDTLHQRLREQVDTLHQADRLSPDERQAAGIDPTGQETPPDMLGALRRLMNCERFGP